MKRAVRAAALGALACSSAALADVLVIRSSSPAYYTGQRVGESQPMRLRHGEELLVLRGNRTHRYCGPGTFQIGQPAQASSCRTSTSGGPRTGAVSSSELSGSRTPGLLVLRSSGPSASRYRVGSRIAPTARLTLRPGDTIVLLQSRGPRQFTGPGTFSASNVFSMVANGGSGRRPRVDAAPPPPPAAPPVDSPNIWQIDIARVGPACVLENTRPVLRRNDATDPERVVVRSEGQPDTILDWPAGQRTLPWPAALPLADGTVYTLALEGESAPAAITIRSVPAELSIDDADLAASTLLALGCSAQLESLLEQDDPPVPFLAPPPAAEPATPPSAASPDPRPGGG